MQSVLRQKRDQIHVDIWHIEQLNLKVEIKKSIEREIPIIITSPMLIYWDNMIYILKKPYKNTCRMLTQLNLFN